MFDPAHTTADVRARNGRGLDELAEYRAELVKRSAASGRNRARDLDLIHSLRRGDAEDA